MNRIVALRRRLHGCPEPSGHEDGTRAIILDFLKTQTTLRVQEMDGWLLATHFEGEDLPTCALRADMDAIPDGCGGARHGCGHDGHSAILCAVALAMEGRRFGKNVHLLFQGAEETGEGARRICQGWPELKRVNRIYALHNIPGFPRGRILIRPGCFACASQGLMVDVQGRPAHAAYPQQGKNPAALLCRTVLALPDMIEDILRGDRRLLMATVVGLHLGSEDFGLSASAGRLCLTLRGDRQADIRALSEAIESAVREEGFSVALSERDVFPDTTNPEDIVREAHRRFEAAGLETTTLEAPMRWSEDFGEYLRRIPGMFFGVGMGEDCPGLHTAEYAFDDGIVPVAVRAFMALIEG